MVGRALLRRESLTRRRNPQKKRRRQRRGRMGGPRPPTRHYLQSTLPTTCPLSINRSQAFRFALLILACCSFSPARIKIGISPRNPTIKLSTSTIVSLSCDPYLLMSRATKTVRFPSQVGHLRFTHQQGSVRPSLSPQPLPDYYPSARRVKKYVPSYANSPYSHACGQMS